MSGIDLGGLVGSYNDHLSQVLPKAVVSNLVIWGSVSLGTVFLFNILRPRNKIIYEPKVKYHVGDKKPPQINDGFFSWLSPLWKTTEPELLDKVGLDAVTFLRFLRLMSWLFLFVSVITCGALIPINVSYNYKHVDPTTRNSLSILTIQDVAGPTLFWHVAATYLINAFALGIIYYNWRRMLQLRYTWFRSDEYTKSFYARTLMVTSVPKKLQSDDGLRSLFAGLGMPYPTTSVHIGHRVGQLPELVEYHNETVRELEKVLVGYLKGGKLGKTRPTITIGGWLGFGGEKKDAIEFYTRKLARTEQAVMEWREKNETNKVENYGFASLAAVPYAHVVAQRLDGKHPKGTTITLAPNPKDIIWKNLTMTDAKRRSQQMIGWLWLALVCFFNTVPLLFISLIANLAHVATFIPFLQTWQNNSQWTFALVNGILPPTISAIFGWFLPKLMRWLSKYQGATTRSRLDRAVVARYFAFLIISQLIIFSLLSTGFNLIKNIVLDAQQGGSVWQILKETKTIPGQIQTTYVSQAPYWLTFFPLRGFLAVFDLAQLLNVVWIWIKTRLFGRTPRDVREWTQPPSFEYAIYYSNLLFMAAVGLVYAPLAPLVALAAAVVFWISAMVYKYQIMFVFVTNVESGGRLWNVVINRLLTSLVFMQLLMTLTIGLAHGWKSFYWVSCLPPLLAVAVCKVWWSRTFMKSFRFYVPSDQEIANAVVHSQSADNKGNRLERRFGHPALHADLFTPMLHSKMMPLLAEVYHGRLGNESTTLEDGHKYEAQIAPGGIKIAGVDQNDLEYDPTLYQRDRGEADWDTKSVSGTTILGGDKSTLKHHKSGFYAAHSGQSIPMEYLQYGPQRAGTPGNLGVQQYEMSRLNSEANLPLLATHSSVSLLQGTTTGSTHSFHERSPSAGPNDAYGSTGYFGSQGQHPPLTQQRSASSMGYHGRSGSGGFDQTVASAAGYPPQQQQQYYDHHQQQQQQPYYENRTRTPPMQPSSRSGSSMGYHHQQNSSMGQVYPSMGSNGRNTPTGYGGGDNSMAGRGAYRQNY